MSKYNDGVTVRNFCSSVILLCILLMAIPLFPSLGVANEDRISLLKQEGRKSYWGIGVPKDYQKALALYLEAAGLGDQDAQYIAGGMYYRGMGTPRDNVKAFKLLHGAALKGRSTPESQKLLGDFFLQGQTVPQNYEQAVKWYKEAAENGDSEAQGELGFLYYIGQGVSQDYKLSFFWFKKAAMRGVATAQYSLGILYYSGIGVEKPDSLQAYSWLSVAAVNKHPDAANARNFISQGLSRDELRKAQDMASKLFDEIPAGQRK